MLGVLNIGPVELLLVLGAAVLLFGGDLPDTARKLGRLMAKARATANDLTRTVYEAERRERARITEPLKEIAASAVTGTEGDNDDEDEDGAPVDDPSADDDDDLGTRATPKA